MRSGKRRSTRRRATLSVVPRPHEYPSSVATHPSRSAAGEACADALRANTRKSARAELILAKRTASDNRLFRYPGHHRSRHDGNAGTQVAHPNCPSKAAQVYEQRPTQQMPDLV